MDRVPDEYLALVNGAEQVLNDTYKITDIHSNCAPAERGNALQFAKGSLEHFMGVMKGVPIRVVAGCECLADIGNAIKREYKTITGELANLACSEASANV